MAMNQVHDFGLCGAAVRISKTDAEAAHRFRRRAQQALAAMNCTAVTSVEDYRGWFTVIAEAEDDDELAKVKALLAEVSPS